MKKDKFVSLLEELNACSEAIKWMSEFEGTTKQAWQQCDRGDWMLWLLGKVNADRKLMVLSACQCARLVLHLNKDIRVITAIETAEAWAKDETTLEELDRAAWAAEAAAWAARAAARAARTAWAAWTAASPGWATWAAEAEKIETLSKCADITRQHFSYDDVIKLIKENK